MARDVLRQGTGAWSSSLFLDRPRTEKLERAERPLPRSALCRDRAYDCLVLTLRLPPVAPVPVSCQDRWRSSGGPFEPSVARSSAQPPTPRDSIPGQIQQHRTPILAADIPRRLDLLNRPRHLRAQGCVSIPGPNSVVISRADASLPPTGFSPTPFHPPPTLPS